MPTGAAGSGGPSGALPVYGNAGAMSKVFNPDMAVIGNFVGPPGRTPIDPSPALALQEAEATFQAVVDPYARADFFSRLLARGCRDRGGIPDVHVAARRAAGEGREAEASRSAR